MKFAVALAAIALVVCPSVVAQQAPPPSQPPPTFRAGTDIVEVEAMVRDKAGRFVSDLAASDFDVRDEGTPQKIELFSVVDGVAPPPTRTATEAAVSTPITKPAVRAPRIFVLVFDTDHLTAGGFVRAKAGAAALFDKYLQPGDIGGVISDGRMLHNRLTSDRGELVADIAALKPTMNGQSRRVEAQVWPRMSDVEAVRIQVHSDRQILDEVVGRACQDDPTLCARGMVESAVRSKAAQVSSEVMVSSTQSVQALKALMNGLGRMEGRKFVLLMSEGFLADDAWPIVQEAVSLAARANARLYTLDARALDTHGMSDYLTGEHPSEVGTLGGLVASFDEGADAMNSLAADTGGFVVRNRNDFAPSIARIADDTDHYYVLGFRPTTPADGTYHALTVKVSREGLNVRARRGYVAMVASAKPTAHEPTAVSHPQESPEPRRDITPATPAESPSAPATGAIVPNTDAATNIFHLRPESAAHINALGRDVAADTDATAGWAAYERGDLEAARARLGAAAARSDARPWVRYALGHADYGVGHYDDAVRQWEEVRTAAAEFEPVYFDLADGYLQQKKYPAAVHVLLEATRRWPHDAEVFNALGVVDMNGGALNDAINAFEAATRTAPSDGVGYFNLGRALETRFLRTRGPLRAGALRSAAVANSLDRDRAVKAYRQYLAIGGALVDSARAGLSRLGAKDKE